MKNTFTGLKPMSRAESILLKTWFIPIRRVINSNLGATKVSKLIFTAFSPKNIM